MDALRIRAERALVRAQALGLTDRRGAPLGIEQMLELLAAAEPRCRAPANVAPPRASDAQPASEPALPGFMREIASAKAHVKRWPQWMQDATVCAAATLPRVAR